jgi:DNA-binding LacI/PurR family transcriptional regulator
MTDEVISKFYRAAPFVAIHSIGALGGAVNIEIDNEAGAYSATKHMIEFGHRRIAPVQLNVSRGIV